MNDKDKKKLTMLFIQLCFISIGGLGLPSFVHWVFPGLTSGSIGVLVIIGSCCVLLLIPYEWAVANEH